MKRNACYRGKLASRILKSFSDRITKQVGWNDVRGYSIKLSRNEELANGKISVCGTFKVSSVNPVSFEYPERYSNAKISWLNERTGTESGLAEKTLRTKSIDFMFEV